MPYDFANAAEIIRLSSGHVPESIEDQLRTLLTNKPRKLHTSLSYDPDGSDFFAELCRQPEYYLTRTEFALLYREAEAIIRTARPESIVDLGCGNFEKTQVLIHEAIKQQGHLDFVPCDIDEHIIATSLPHLAHFYGSGLRVRALVGDYETCLDYLAGGSESRLFTFIGSTFGNLTPDERASLLTSLRDCMTPDDRFLLGVDLVKSPEILEAAYNDAAGCIRASMMQMLVNLNRAYGANFNLEGFRHQSRYEAENRTVVSYLISQKRQKVRIEGLGVDLDISEGEEIQAEIREKFILHDLLDTLFYHGFTPSRVVLDDMRPYALILMRAI